VERSVIVTWHAVKRARSRYGDAAIHPGTVRADVVAAVEAGREGVKMPRELAAYRSKRARHSGTRYCWTADLGRVYVVKRIRDSRRDYGHALIVLTAVAGLKP
jgi:hypothetical protein